MYFFFQLLNTRDVYHKWLKRREKREKKTETNEKVICKG